MYLSTLLSSGLCFLRANPVSTLINLFIPKSHSVPIISFFRIFLEHGGNPNKTNGRKETSLHCVCMEKNQQFYVRQRRADSLLLILKWRGATLQEGETEKVDLAAQDEVLYPRIAERDQFLDNIMNTVQLVRTRCVYV